MFSRIAPKPGWLCPGSPSQPFAAPRAPNRSQDGVRGPPGAAAAGVMLGAMRGPARAPSAIPFGLPKIGPNSYGHKHHRDVEFRKGDSCGVALVNVSAGIVHCVGVFFGCG